MAQINNEKAAKLYDIIDNSPLYHNSVAAEDRSIHERRFSRQAPKRWDANFVTQAQSKGHLQPGGPRNPQRSQSRIYNALPAGRLRASPNS
jgi:phosphoserine aminotransferase